MPDALVRIGKVVSVNAPRRTLRVKPAANSAKAFNNLEWIYVERTNEKPLKCKVERSAPAGDAMQIELVAGVTRDSVTRMEGAIVSIAREPRRQRRSKDDFHISETVGLNVVNERGEAIGKVMESYSTPANDVIEVELPNGDSVLVPAVPEAIAEVDFERGVVVIADFDRYVTSDEN
jgi:16S rRNA processing protein RimM